MKWKLLEHSTIVNSRQCYCMRSCCPRETLLVHNKHIQAWLKNTADHRGKERSFLKKEWLQMRQRLTAKMSGHTFKDFNFVSTVNHSDSSDILHSGCLAQKIIDQVGVPKVQRPQIHNKAGCMKQVSKSWPNNNLNLTKSLQECWSWLMITVVSCLGITCSFGVIRLHISCPVCIFFTVLISENSRLKLIPQVNFLGKNYKCCTIILL